MRFVNPIRLNSLSLKVLVAYLAGTLLSIALLVIAAVVMVNGRDLAQMDLTGLAEGMAEKMRFDSNGNPIWLDADADGDDLAWVFDSLRRETAYRLLDERGSVALVSPAGEKIWPTGQGLPHLVRGRFDFEHEGVTLYAVTEPIKRAGRTWYFQVAVSTRLMTLLHRVALPLVGAGVAVFSLVLLVAFGLCAYFTLRYTLKPLRDLSVSAAAISPRSMHARLKREAVPAEIAPLVDSFNRVLERLERGYRVQQEFLGNAVRVSQHHPILGRTVHERAFLDGLGQARHRDIEEHGVFLVDHVDAAQSQFGTGAGFSGIGRAARAGLAGKHAVIVVDVLLVVPGTLPREA